MATRNPKPSPEESKSASTNPEELVQTTKITYEGGEENGNELDCCDELIDRLETEGERLSQAVKNVGNVETAARTVGTNIDTAVNNLTDVMRTGVSVSLQRTTVKRTSDIALWFIIRQSANAISFENYSDFLNVVFCEVDETKGQTSPPLFSPPSSPPGFYAKQREVYGKLRSRRFLPFNDTDAYRLLKVATEAFLLVNSGVPLTSDFDFNDSPRLKESGFTVKDMDDFWEDYLGKSNGTPNLMIPYLTRIRSNLRNEELKSQIFIDEGIDIDEAEAEKCVGILRRKLLSPFLFELIWSYWQEEGMLVQTINAITRRFQNVRSPGGAKDPLANLEIDTLRPLSNLLWGYIQDEQHRLSLIRRVYEYDHHYGITLKGKAVPKIHPADSRSKFLEAFHHLLHISSMFFKQDDDTTVIADGFPLLNGLKEVHLILSQGAHNQFGDLPSTARQEMLIQQWILARPEFREFLPTRLAVAYPEPWMYRVEAMKNLQGWNDTSIIHFHNLAVFGEQLLLSIRYGDWGSVIDSAQAGNWARHWRPEIQGYIHAYRAVTGVDLSSFTSSDRIDSTPPSVHLFNRYKAQTRGF